MTMSQLYDYPKIIPKLMDLGTVKSKLEQGKYADASDCANDIRLVWKNCMTYNADGSDFYRLADSYCKRFDERYQKLIDEFGEEIVCAGSGGAFGASGNGGAGGGEYGSGSGRGDSAAPPPNSKPSSSSGRKSRSNSFTSSAGGRNTPVPRGGGGGGGMDATNNKGIPTSSSVASKSDKVDYESLGIVPLDVRTRFAARLQRLSGMELGHVLQVIDMQCPDALEDPTEEQLRSDAAPVVHNHRYAWDEFDGGCQIEVDVDAIPPETFWKLDTYVKEKVQGRGRGPWSDELTDTEPGAGSKKRKMKSF